MTKLIKEKSFRPFLNIDINRLFREDIDALMKTFDSAPSSSLPANTSVDNKAAYIEIAAAGYTNKDVNVSSKEQVLTIIITASEEEVPQDSKVDDKVYFSKKISKRSFKKDYTFSSEFDTSKTEAKMENGLLKITVPRKPNTIAVEITVK